MAQNFQIPADHPTADLLRALTNEVNSLRSAVTALTFYSIAQNAILCHATKTDAALVRSEIMRIISGLKMEDENREAIIAQVAFLCGNAGAEIVPFPGGD